MGFYACNFPEEVGGGGLGISTSRWWSGSWAAGPWR
jgi:hypothetical protein